MCKPERINKTLQIKIKDRATRTPLKTGSKLGCSGRVGSSCSTCGTRRVTLATNPVISHEWAKNLIVTKRNEIPMTDYWRYILHKHITTQMGYYFLKIIPSKLLQGWRVSSKRYQSIIATWMGCHHPWCLHLYKCHSIVFHQRISWDAFYLRGKLEYPEKTKQPPPAANHWQTSSHKVVSIISR
jgi:hypothetical protein